MVLDGHNLTAAMRSTPDPDRYRVLTFDCYGTLIDWESGLLALLSPWSEHHGLRCSGEELLQRHAHHEPRVQEGEPGLAYPQILERVWHRIAADFGVPVQPGEAEGYGSSVGDWPAFPDSAAALRRLAGRFALVIVSNVDNASLLRSRQRLGDPFRAVVTAEDVGAYKPDMRMFDAALRTAATLGAAPDQVLHVAQSLFHDHVPAARAGLDSVWVDRRGGGGATRHPGEQVAPMARVADLASLAVMLGT